jgi:septal ring factor EnvC (AmiA/AmiB activator)
VRQHCRAPAFLASVAAALALLVAAVLTGAGPVTAAPAKAPPSAVGELDLVRQQCIAAARDAQSREQTVAALEHTIGLLERDTEGRQRDLDESRAEQARLLGTLAYLARNPPERPGFAPPAAIERIRGEMLLQGTLPGLRAEARALAGEIERIAVLRAQIATKEDELAGARQARGEDRRQLAELIAQRLDLTRRILPEDSAGPTRTLRLGQEASNIGDLIKRAAAAAEHRDKEVLARARAALPADKASALTAEAADPTRPHQLHAFDPPHAVLVTPVSGPIARRFGAADPPTAAGAPPNQGLSLAALPGAIAVAPFDGRVIYAGPFRNLGLCLIIRHGGLYYSLLAGLERIDITADQWVLAGEPVGIMPEASGGALYFELRHDDRPVDPQPWLAPGAAGQDEPDGDQRMRE